VLLVQAQKGPGGGERLVWSPGSTYTTSESLRNRHADSPLRQMCGVSFVFPPSSAEVTGTSVS